jgi:hypothetical protein
VAQDEGHPRSEFLSPADLQQWLRQELADSAKAFELRSKEAAEFVNAYAAGKISAEEAEDRHWRYEHRWGEALPGVHAGEHMTDQQILRAIDRAIEEAEGPYTSPAETRKKLQQSFGKRSGRGDISR